FEESAHRDSTGGAAGAPANAFGNPGASDRADCLARPNLARGVLVRPAPCGVGAARQWQGTTAVRRWPGDGTFARIIRERAGPSKAPRGLDRPGSADSLVGDPLQGGTGGGQRAAVQAVGSFSVACASGCSQEVERTSHGSRSPSRSGPGADSSIDSTA